MESRSASTWFFCTARGLGICLFFTYLIIIPIQFHHDIIASMIVYCFGTLMGCLALGVLYSGLKTKKMIGITIGMPDPDAEYGSIVTSGLPALLSIDISGAHTLPFTSLFLKIYLTSEDLQPISLKLEGSIGGMTERTFVPVTFPHRGVWKVEAVEWKLRDDFALWQFASGLSASECAASIVVTPPDAHSEGAPVINSCLRDGDSIADVRDPKGDLYDLRKYHPSDGLKKIVWKIYAKSGELLSRHPERTMTPEGKVLILVWADRYEDSACSLAVHYCRHLEEIGLEFALVCRGMEHGEAAHTSEAVQSLLIDTAWEAHARTTADTPALISRLVSQVQSSHDVEIVTHLVVIGSTVEERPKVSEQLEEVGVHIANKGYLPVFLLATPFSRLEFAANPPSSSILNTVVGFFIAPEESAALSYFDPHDFPRRAAFNRWEYYEVLP